MRQWTCGLFAVLALLSRVSADDQPKPARDPELQKELLKRVKAEYVKQLESVYGPKKK